MNRVWWRLKRWLTLRRFRSVAIMGMFSPYSGDADEVWGCNRCYVHGVRMTRLFIMDPLETEEEAGRAEYIESCNRLNIPIVLPKKYPEIPLSEAFPLNKVRGELKVRDYYTSTIAYMIAEAIRQGFGKIIIHRILVNQRSVEYVEQKPCLDAWVMFAHGLGIEVGVSDDSMIMRPYPWQSETYGYISNDHHKFCSDLLADAMREIGRVPALFRRWV